MNARDKKDIKKIMFDTLIDYHEGTLMPAFEAALKRIDENRKDIKKNQVEIKNNQKNIEFLMKKLDRTIERQEELNKEFIGKINDQDERIDLLEGKVYPPPMF